MQSNEYSQTNLNAAEPAYSYIVYSRFSVEVELHLVSFTIQPLLYHSVQIKSAIVNQRLL